MKTSNKILLGGLAFIILSLLSLMIAARVSIIPVERIEGNGQMKTKTRDVGAFNSIEVNTSNFDIYLADGPSKVEVTGDENLLGYLETHVENGLLKIERTENKKINSRNRLAITISVGQIKEITLNSSCNINGLDTLNLSDFQVAVNGSGDVNLVLKA